ncbi:hypothetical protein SDJN02_18756, partial [Cucurbita argyrosperma subsp. argyrosperma]
MGTMIISCPNHSLMSGFSERDFGSTPSISPLVLKSLPEPLPEFCSKILLDIASICSYLCAFRACSELYSVGKH